MGGYNLDNYVPVAERLNKAHEDIQSIETEAPVMLSEAMGYIRARVSLKSGRFADGTATFRLDLQGRSAQATNPIEDCETSAVGRALALLGYESSRSVASREDVEEARRRAAAQPQKQQQPNQGGERAALLAQLRQARERLQASGGVPRPLNQQQVNLMTGEELRAEIEQTLALVEG